MPAPPGLVQFSRGRSIAYSLVLVLGFFALAEGTVRLVGVSMPRVPPRLLIREMDTDITLPFMREDHELFWAPQPGFRGTFRGRRVTINALGLRGPEVTVPKPAGRKRVACFGDSITFGYAVGDEETYPHRLGLALSARGVEVVNAGVTGYTSHQVRGLLERVAPALAPDVATFCIGWNDQNPRPVTDRDYQRRLRAATAVEGGLDRLHLYKAMRSLYLRSVLRKLPETREARRVPLDHYRENMRAIVAACRSRGIVPVFVDFPRRRRAGEARVESVHAKALAGLARELDVPLLGVGELGLDTPLDSNEDDFIDGLHFSPAGAEVMARELARQLVALGIV